MENSDSKNSDRRLIDVLTPVWEGVLRRSPILPDDNFFDLGGDQALAEQLICAMSAALGSDTPLTLIYDAPTIASVVKAWADGNIARSSALVLLREGREAPPIFFFHGLGGTLIEFAPLAKRSWANHPIYGIQSRGLNPGVAPDDRIEAMAAHCLEAIKEIQQHGPFYLVGNSTGGLVALEAAQRLLRQGEKVALLALLDTYPYPRFWPREAWLSVLRRRIKHHWSVVRQMSRRELLPYMMGRWETLQDHFRSRLGGRLRKPVSDGVVIPMALRRLREGFILAFSNYRPKPYRGKIIFFKPKVATQFPDDPKMVWRSLAEEVEVHMTPGDHVGMSTVHADVLAAELLRCIETLPSGHQ